jgi:1-phosphofructokinase
MISRVVTVTLNPAIDETVTLDHLRPGEVHRATSVHFNAGGKGVNAASCLADWSPAPKVFATGLLGAANASTFETLFAAKNIADQFIRIPGETRTNIKLSHDGETTDINLPGPMVDAASAGKIRQTIIDLAAADTLVLLGGSLPAGMGDGFYAELTEALNARGALVLVDTSGGPFAQVLNARTLPYCIKPNRSELEHFAQSRLETDDDIISTARQLIGLGLGLGLVIVSLGAEGSLYISRDQTLRARLPPVRPTSTVGAGDAMVAGIIAAVCEEAPLEGIARLATAFAAAKLGEAGPNLPARKIVEELRAQVQITNLGSHKQ